MDNMSVTFNFDWNVWVPVVIASLSLLVSWLQMNRQAKRHTLLDVEAKIDKAADALGECEDRLRHYERENDALRREKYALLEQIARIHRGDDNQGRHLESLE